MFCLQHTSQPAYPLSLLVLSFQIGGSAQWSSMRGEEIKLFKSPYLGAGSFSTVCRGRWLDAPVAVKCISIKAKKNRGNIEREIELWWYSIIMSLCYTASLILYMFVYQIHNIYIHMYVSAGHCVIHMLCRCLERSSVQRLCSS